MDEKTRKLIINNVDNPWEFAVKASKKYKEEFLKTAGIGSPPKIDKVMADLIIEKTGKDKPEKEKDEKKSQEEEQEKEKNTEAAVKSG